MSVARGRALVSPDLGRRPVGVSVRRTRGVAAAVVRECPHRAARRSRRWQAVADWALVLAVVAAVWWWVPVGAAR